MEAYKEFRQGLLVGVRMGLDHAINVYNLLPPEEAKKALREYSDEKQKELDAYMERNKNE